MNLQGESDDRLMELAASGDNVAFDQIVRRHQDRLQRFATRMLGGDQARGADVAIGALLRLWETRRSYQPCGKLGSWLLKVTNRLCLDNLAGSSSISGLNTIGEPIAGSFHSAFERIELAAAVRTAVMELPETHRNVLILSVYEEMSYDEIAEALEISLGTVASRKNHAIAALRRRLTAWETRS